MNDNSITNLLKDIKDLSSEIGTLEKNKLSLEKKFIENISQHVILNHYCIEDLSPHQFLEDSFFSVGFYLSIPFKNKQEINFFSFNFMIYLYPRDKKFDFFDKIDCSFSLYKKYKNEYYIEDIINNFNSHRSVFHFIDDNIQINKIYKDFIYKTLEQRFQKFAEHNINKWICFGLSEKDEPFYMKKENLEYINKQIAKISDGLTYPLQVKNNLNSNEFDQINQVTKKLISYEQAHDLKENLKRKEKGLKKSKI